MKVQINSDIKTTKVLLDGQDIGSVLTGVSVELRADCYPIVRLEVVPNELEIEGDFEVLKKIKEDENVKVNLKFSMGDIKAEIGTDEFAKELSKHLGEILHGINNQAL